jgi:hypothetical protein
MTQASAECRRERRGHRSRRDRLDDSQDAHAHTLTTASAGSGRAHDNVQPTMIVNHILRII